MEDENHKRELEKVVETCRAETKSEALRDALQETNFYSRQKEYNVMAIAYQKMEEFLMNRIRQLTTMVNRNNTLVTESLQASEALSIPDGMVSTVTKAQLMEMRQTLPVVNMNYVKEVVVKSVRGKWLTPRFISFPRGSSERTFLYPVLKTLLSLGEREMRVGMKLAA